MVSYIPNVETNEVQVHVEQNGEEFLFDMQLASIPETHEKMEDLIEALITASKGIKEEYEVQACFDGWITVEELTVIAEN